MSTDRWTAEQREYWEHIAGTYDSLYDSRWAQLENSLVGSLIRAVAPKHKHRIADFGCGTALGARLCGDLSDAVHYTGIDISPAMLQQARDRLGERPNTLICCDMDDVPSLTSESQDLVLCLFTSLSFAAEPDLAVKEMARVLKPGAYAVISVLSRFALRRLVHASFSDLDHYRTRGDATTNAPPGAHTFTSGSLRALAESHSFAVERVVGLSAFADLCEVPALWPLDRLLCNMAPNVAHILFVVAKKSK